MILQVMSVAYERPIRMQTLINSFLMQTNPNWALTIIHDGFASQSVRDVAKAYSDPRIRYYESPTRNSQYGHPNRKTFIEEFNGVLGDFLLLTNDDNYYVPVFVEKILGACTPDTGFVYCDCVHSHFDYDVLKTTVRVDRIDVGSFAVRADVAKAVGFNHFEFNGDGMYAEECVEYCSTHGLTVSYVPKPIFIHN